MWLSLIVMSVCRLRKLPCHFCDLWLTVTSRVLVDCSLILELQGFKWSEVTECFETAIVSLVHTQDLQFIWKWYEWLHVTARHVL